MQLKAIPIASIIIGERFRKDYGNIHEFAANILEKGLIQPITVDQHNNLLAGGRRIQAHIHLGLPTIRALVRQSSGELDRREIELFENIHRKEMHWSEKAKLQAQIEKLMRAQHGLQWTVRKQARATGVKSTETVHRLTEMGAFLEFMPGLAKFDTEKEARAEVKRLGRQAAITSALANTASLAGSLLSRAEADYRIGDVFEGMASERSSSFDFAEVDPPYGINLITRKRRNEDKSLNGTYREISAEEYPAWFKSLATEVYRLLKPNSFAIFWYGIDPWHNMVIEALQDAGFSVNGIPGIWYKTNIAGQTASPSTMMGNSYETFFVARKGMPQMQQPGRKNVFECDVVSRTEKDHSTEKPIELYTDIISTFVTPASKVLIPFLGSGATLRAIYTLPPEQKITGIGWDRSPTHKKMFLGKVLAYEASQVRNAQ